MFENHRTFRCQIVTPRGTSYSLSALAAIIPTEGGMVGVLGGRGPLAVTIGTGVLRLTLDDGSHRMLFLAGGFGEFVDDELRLLPEDCEPVEELDRDAAWAELERARAMPQATRQQAERRTRAIVAARTKFDVVQRHRRRTGKG